ncbi:MAG: hypothetical protein GY941_07860 [Planctomycetes bacterium]|nr:hypothetical protein [Planctomycetota bacterium]
MKRNIILLPLIVVLFLLNSSCKTIEMETARQAAQRNELETAYKSYLEALKKDPENKEALSEIKVVRAKLINPVISEADNLVKLSPQPTIPLIEEAISKLDAVSQFDPGGKLLNPSRKHFEELITQIRDANRALSQRVRVDISTGDFELARKNIQKIKISDPSAGIIRTLNGEYNSAYKTFLEQKMTALLKKKKFKEAREILRQIEDLKPSSDEKVRLTNLFKKYELKKIESDVDVMLSKNQYYKAYLTIIDNGYKELLSTKLVEISLRGSQFYLWQATKRLELGEVSKGYLAAVKGLELDSRLTNMFETHRDARDEILKMLQKYIAISAFGAPSDNPDAGPQFSDALISYLFRTLPYGINIVEREKIDMLMDEHKREFKEVGDILNVDIIVTGNVSLMKIDKQNTESVATIRAKVGEKRETNPEYEMALRVRRNSTSTVNLPPLPPASVKVPVYENFKYTKGKTTVKGFANVSVRIFDTHKGSITYADEFNANYKATDEYQDSVEPAGVTGDPLEILSDTEVTEKLRNEIIKQLADVIQKQFEERAKLFLQDAKYHIARKEVDRAINFLAQGFLYCVKAQIAQDNSYFSEIRKLIVEETERNFLEL